MFVKNRVAAFAAKTAVAAALVFAMTHYWHAHSAGRIPAQGDPVAAAAQVVVTGFRITGTIEAFHSTTLLAPRVQGNRAGMNRGGAGSAATIAGVATGGVSDFNLVLLSLAAPGSHVKAGDVVARFDPQNQVQRVDDYRDTVIQSEASTRSMLASLAAALEDHDQTVREAEAAREDAELQLQAAPARAAIDAESDKIDAEEAEATYRQLEQEASLLEESQRAQIRISELNHNQAELELKRAEANVEKMTIRAPMDGIVVMASTVRNGEYGQIRQGDQVNPGQPFMYIVNPGSLILNGSVNQVDAEKLRVGMKATIRVDAYPDCDLPGVLTGIGALAQASTFRGSYVSEIPVRFSINAADPRLIPDLTASAEIAITE
jgi:HlyD family secretion protein